MLNTTPDLPHQQNQNKRDINYQVTILVALL
jgi:hypothetical protein